MTYRCQVCYIVYSIRDIFPIPEGRYVQNDCYANGIYIIIKCIPVRVVDAPRWSGEVRAPYKTIKPCEFDDCLTRSKRIQKLVQITTTVVGGGALGLNP